MFVILGQAFYTFGSLLTLSHETPDNSREEFSKDEVVN